MSDTTETDTNGTRSKVEMAKGLIRDLGFPIVVASYFLYRDWVFNEQMILLQAKIAHMLEQLVRLH